MAAAQPIFQRAWHRASRFDICSRFSRQIHLEFPFSRETLVYKRKQLLSTFPSHFLNF